MAVDKTQSLLKLMEVERDARDAQTKAVLGYHIVTRTREITPYYQAIFLSVTPNDRAEIESVSDVAAPDLNGPFCLLLKKVVQTILSRPFKKKIKEIEPNDLPQDLKEQWVEWAHKHVLWVPLLSGNGRLIGGLILSRGTPWQDRDTVLLERLGHCYAHAWGALSIRKKIFARPNKKIIIASLACVALLGLVPVQQSALAPAEVVPENPFVIAAPMEGVVSDVFVKPYQRVKEGQALVKFDETVLRNQVDIARETLEVTKAKLQTTRQSAFHDFDSQSKLSFLEAQVDLRRAELIYAENLLERNTIYAPRNGVAIFRDVNDWMGKPTQTGEKIMLLADPQKKQLRIDLPVRDAITLNQGAKVRLFLDIDPLSSYSATLSRTAYETQLSPDGQGLDFQLMANFEDSENAPRIGLRGTAKVYGEGTLLGLYIFRKPFSALRMRFGW
ncbi:efflux RND transporter periplasmic adaptor subunit [Terasakiella pusilla]|uniref:efflux RND transporter periplasmic adaptor subunit n=1 Tax=Terasakiella pusilla TaxID=64973 RepID=UPI00048B035F|nr:HlyD family efflux transporter periplasmic adaptor subunit [Terasakiella pusilla]